MKDTSLKTSSKDANNAEVFISKSHEKDILNRMATIVGHTAAVKRMLEEGIRDESLVNQLSAIESSIYQLKKLIMLDYISESIYTSAAHGDADEAKNVIELIKKMIK